MINGKGARMSAEPWVYDASVLATRDDLCPVFVEQPNFYIPPDEDWYPEYDCE